MSMIEKEPFCKSKASCPTISDMTGPLLETLADLETAFMQFHQRLLLVKQNVHDLHSMGSRSTDCSKEIGAQDGDGTVKTNIFEDVIVCQSKLERQVSMGVVEPDALRLHRRNKLDATKTPLDGHNFIRASAFGLDDEQKYELRMSPEWKELATKSNRALGAVTSILKKKSTGSANSDIIRSLLTTKQTKTLSLLQKTRSSAKLTIDIKLVSPLKNCHMLEFLKPTSPHSLPRMSWDIVGCLLLTIDAFLLPVTLAWGVAPSSSMAGRIVLWVSLSFWVVDIFANANTGFYIKGTLCLNRKKIIKNYMARWLAFDLFLVSLDILALAPSDGSHVKRFASTLRNVRVWRVLRAFRLLRLLKMKYFSVIIEEIAATSRPWLLIIMSMMKAVMLVVITVHWLSCLWYFIGSAVHDSGRKSWLENSGAVGIHAVGQYLHALQWLLTPPAPAPIEPANLEERIGNIFIVMFTLAVMGSTLGKLTSALQELSAMKSETTRKRRQIRSYLHSNATSKELISRIMRFVDHRLASQEAKGAVDLSLISASLQMELYVNQRSVFFEKLPLFHLTKKLYPVVYAEILAAATKHGFEGHEVIFQAGEFATAMIITAVGDYILAETNPKHQVLFSGVRWFAESCLYSEGMIHSQSLRAGTFCDAFTLTSRRLQTALQDSPTCTYMFCEYAKDLLSALKQCQDPTDYDLAAAISLKATKQNTHYMECYPDPDALIENFGPPVPMCAEYDEKAARETQELSAKHFIEQTMNGSISDQKQLVEGLRRMFFELDPESGSHATFSQGSERERSEASCLSILNLVTDHYENFTRPQNPAVRLTSSQWQELREIIRWIAPEQKEVHAVVVLLAIRSLGKSKKLAQQLPSEHQGPEAAVMHLINAHDNVVPSVRDLDEGTCNLLIGTLHVHEKFNFAQMLQGENCPANVLQLREVIREDVELFKFYMLFLLGFMSGLAAGEGSRFMTSTNAQGIIDGCRALKPLMATTPQVIYWNYMTERARALRIPTETPEDLALVRLACLHRVQNYSSYASLRNAWMTASIRSRKVLIGNLLADGISERAFVLEFLPLCISNATKNICVRLPALLEVIVDLLDNLAPSFHASDEMIVTVELSDLAEFVSAVKNRFVFQSCILRCDVRRARKRVYIEMSPANWMRTNDAETDTAALANDVKQVLDRVDLIEAALEKSDESVLRLNTTCQPKHTHAPGLRSHSKNARTISKDTGVQRQRFLSKRRQIDL